MSQQVTEGSSQPGSAPSVAEVLGDALTGLGRSLSRLGSIDVFTMGLIAIIIVQAVWQTILMHAGWYYQADFDNLASATGASLNWGYLTTSQGGHLDITGRVVLWVLNRTVPLNYGVTIALRVIASAVVTYLLGRLLRELAGARRGVLALVLLFSLSPFLVQSTLWLTSSINFLISELLVLAALRAHVRYAVTRLPGWAVLTGLAMFGATLVAEQAAVSALALPLLTLGFLSDGSVRDRLRAVWQCWLEWVLIAVPILAFAFYYFASGKYATKTHGFTIGDAGRLIAQFWFNTLVPGLFGGPLAWSTPNGNYFALSNPPLVVRIVALVLLVVAVTWTVRRTSMWALCGWAVPAIVSAVGLVFVGRARYELFGELAVTRHFEYASYAAVPLAVGVALAIWAPPVAEVRARVTREPVPAPAADPVPAPAVAADAPPTRHALPRRWTAASIVVALVVLSLISGGTYAHYWSKSPSKGYVSRLSEGLSHDGDNATVFNTFVANDVLPGIDVHRHVSDLLSLMRSHAHLDNGPIPAKVVNSKGDLVRASFLSTATVKTTSSNNFCNDIFQGQTVKTQPLNVVPHLNEWFLRLTYFEQRPTIINVHVVTAGHLLVSPVGGSQILLQEHVGVVYLELPLAKPAAVRIQGATSATNVCMTAIAVGYPFPAQK